jgi:hypothetical protein
MSHRRLLATIEGMNRSAFLGLGSAGLTYLVAVAAVLGFGTAPAASQVRAPAATVIQVTAGQPTEWRFTLSKKSGIPLGAVVFRVKNSGALPHLFKVCANPSKTAKPNACTGKATRLLAPGKSATLKVMFKTSGKYEYLCTSGAKKGMKGLITISAKAPVAATSPPKTSTTPAATSPTSPTSPPATTAPSSGGASGDAAAGALVYKSAGCASCHSNIDEIRSYGGVGPNFNSTHPEPFESGPLTAKQVADLAAYIG